MPDGLSGCRLPPSSRLDGRGNAVEHQCPVLVSCLVPLSCPDDFTPDGLGKSTAWCIFINDGPQKPKWMKLLTRPPYHGREAHLMKPRTFMEKKPRFAMTIA